MKRQKPTVHRQIIAEVFAEEPRAYLVAEWPDGARLPRKVVRMIMDTWTTDDSWVDTDGSILFVHERRQRGRMVAVERYPLILVDENQQVLYGVEALQAAKERGVPRVKTLVIDAVAHGFPPKGHRRPVS